MTISFAHRHVLEDHIAGFETKPNAHHLEIVRRPAIATVLAHAGSEVRVAAALEALDEAALRLCGPAEWMIVSESTSVEGLITQAGEIPGVSVFDHSDGRVLMRISGTHVRKVLAKCLAVDLHPDAFPLGHSANMAICHVAGNLARTGQDRFEIIVPRSFAGSVFEDLKEMGREFALTSGFAGT